MTAATVDPEPEVARARMILRLCAYQGCAGCAYGAYARRVLREAGEATS